MDPTDAGLDPSAPASPESQRRALWWVLGINAAMFAVELVAGLVAQSTGLVADSLDMLADASIYAIALVAAGDAARQRRSARLSGWLQLTLAALVLVEVIRRALSGSEPVEALMVVDRAAGPGREPRLRGDPQPAPKGRGAHAGQLDLHDE